MKLNKTVLAAMAVLSMSTWAMAAQVTDHQKYPLVMDQSYYIQSSAADRTLFPQGMNAAFGSGLAYDGHAKDGSVQLLSITDRGPNLDGMDVIYQGKKYPTKLFPAPDFHPEIGTVVLRNGQAVVTGAMPIRDSEGTPISGRPIPPGLAGSTGEIALDYNLNGLPYDPNGLDTEAISLDKAGHIWISDEYGPFVVELDQHAKELAKYGPGTGLPDIVGQRTPNRGAEGMTVLPNGHVLFLIQSILNLNGETSKTASFCRVYDWNPKDKSYKTYAYPIEQTYSKPGDAKLGDAFALDNNRILIIEQGAQADKSMMNRIYMIDLSKGRDITDLTINGKAPEYAAAAEMQPYMVSKELVLDLRQYGWDTEKAEGMTMSPDHKTMYLSNDNDFGIATKITDPAHPNAKLKSYLYDMDNKTIYYVDKDGNRTAADPKIEMEVGPDQAEVWSFTFDEAL